MAKRIKTIGDHISDILFCIGILLWLCMPISALMTEVHKTRTYNEMANAYMEIRFAAMAIQTGQTPSIGTDKKLWDCAVKAYGDAVNKTVKLETK